MITEVCPECSSTQYEAPTPDDKHHRICWDCSQEYWTNIEYQKKAPAFKTEEISGGKCGYYEVDVKFPVHQPRVYRAECIDLIEALELTPHEANVFKCIWRKAAQRQGKSKEGNTALRDAEKITFFAIRILELERYNAE